MRYPNVCAVRYNPRHVMDDAAKRAVERAAIQEVARLMLTWAARLEVDSVLGARFADRAERALLALHRQEGRRGE